MRFSIILYYLFRRLFAHLIFCIGGMFFAWNNCIRRNGWKRTPFLISISLSCASIFCVCVVSGMMERGEGCKDRSIEFERGFGLEFVKRSIMAIQRKYFVCSVEHPLKCLFNYLFLMCLNMALGNCYMGTIQDLASFPSKHMIYCHLNNNKKKLM